MSYNGIKLTQCGQPRPYADSIFAGTVTAENEQEARDKLQKMRYLSEPIFERQDRGDKWSHCYFEYFRLLEPGKWEFKIIQPSTS